jgi:CubicO group peptidase (beta-lactamase class C family)
VADLDDVLTAIDDHPVDDVAAGVTDVDATLASRGSTDAVFAFASVTKPLAAYGVLVAVQDRSLHLDEPVDVPDAPDGITVRHLLAHASGLPLDPGGLVGVPGRKRIYSNWGYDVLGELVAERTGHPFPEHLDLEVLRPLGMTGTVLDGSPAHAARGTIGDLLAFGRELLAPTLIDPELHREATSVVFDDLDGVVPGYGRQQPNDWGLGFELRGAKDPHWCGGRVPAATFGHFGRAGSFLLVDPEHRVAAAYLCDRDFDAWAKEVWPPLTDAIVGAVAGDDA